jgi:hypothetical protein
MTTADTAGAGAVICYPPGMARTPRPSVAALALTMGLAGCGTQAPTPTAEAQRAAVDPAAAPADPAPAEATTPPPLTEDELALIAADPKDLTPELRRKRAYARRKQIMQNPDSPTARALNDLAAAHQAGDIEVQRKGDGVWLSTPGTKPTSGRPPAGWRPPAEGSPAPASEPPAAGAAAEAGSP